jgi:processive 1,2-diacylglycerol beta-glucosyltransferase
MDLMKVLILSVSAGGGHTQAAEALKKSILSNSPDSEVLIIDTIKYINPILDKVVIGSYLKSLKLSPAIFGKIYNLAESEDGLATFSNKIVEIVVFRLIPLINEVKPDIIVATHPFSAEMVSVLKSKEKINIPAVTIMTDYASHNFWLHPSIDAYVVSNDDMVNEMVSRGVPREIVHSLGIPVSPDFLKLHDRNETLSALELDASRNTVLLMGGSLGMGKIQDVYEQLQEINGDIQIIVITGNNKRLYSKLLDFQPYANNTTRVIGFTKEVNKYMQACDLLITKPGGMTITEALISTIPLAIFSAIPGHEEKNAEFLLKHGLAISLSDGKNCKSIIEKLLMSPDELSNIKQNCKKYAKPNSGDSIYKLFSELIVNYR